MGRGATLLEPSSPLGRPEAEGGGRLGQGESPGVSLARAGTDPAPGLQAVLKNLAEAVGGCYHCYSLDPEVSLLPCSAPAPRQPPPRFTPASGPGPSRLRPTLGGRTRRSQNGRVWRSGARSHERAPVSARDELQTRPEPGAVLNPSGCTGESPSSPPRAPRGSESESAAPWRAEGGPDCTASSAPAPRPPSASLSQWVNDSSTHPVPTAEVAVSSRVRIRRGDRTPAVRSADRPRRACSPCTAASKRVFASHTFKCHKVERFTEGCRDRATFF